MAAPLPNEDEPTSRGRARSRAGGMRRRREETDIFSRAGGEATKGFKSAISEIAQDTLNTGQNKFAAQFMQSHKNVANYLQRTSASEGYLVAKTVRTGREQTIPLPAAVDAGAPDAADMKIIRDEEVKMIAKRRLKLQRGTQLYMTSARKRCETSSRRRTTWTRHKGINPSTSSFRRSSVYE